MTTYSEQELADKAFIERRCCITDEEVQFYIDHFNKPGGGNASTFFNILPNGRCSDGKRRYTCAEYIDFLFQSPTIEECIEAANAKPERNFVITLDFSNIQSVDVRMTPRS